MARELNPAENFRDDGGTPAWRANQATWRPANNRPALWPLLLLAIFWRPLTHMGALAGAVFVWAFLAVGVLLIVLWDLIERTASALF